MRSGCDISGGDLVGYMYGVVMDGTDGCGRDGL